MNPSQPTAPGTNPYEFITNPTKPPKKPLIGGNSFMKKIIVIVGGAVLLMIVLTVVVSIFAGGGNNTAELKNLVAEQEEIIRVADLGLAKAQDSLVRSQAITAKLSTDTQQQELVRYLEGLNVKVDEKELALQKNAQTDAKLEEAAANNRFEDVFQATLTELLNNYSQSLQDAYNHTTNENTRVVLNSSYKSTAQLLGFK